ncbi:MAG: sugar isomerase [Phycisphaerae bacterium]|nr:sugar isomerase [Phycisphaerae bacterium]
MNNSEKYSKYALCKEMLETPGIIREFSSANNNIEAVSEAITTAGKLFLTGEGSSRIFPAKNAIRFARGLGMNLELDTEGSRQAAEYDLKDWVIFGASNSGQTKELICLFDTQKQAGNDKLYGLTANAGTKLQEMSKQAFVLKCGKENAVAATKSVAEQALFYQSILCNMSGFCKPYLKDLMADGIEDALTMEIDPTITKAIANAGTIYFAGRNDGVAEELTLKTNEITRKKSDYLEGTYAVHGIEEVMNANDVVILIDPYEAELEKIKTTLADGVGLTVIAISTKDTIFPTIKVKDAEALTTYVMLAAGWNILVEVGIELNIDLDKPVRARKIGNAY